MKALFSIAALIVIAALVVSFGWANAQTPSSGSNMSGSGQFCLKSSSGNIHCAYQTTGACEMAKTPNSADQCIERAKPETIGSGPAPTTSPAPSNAPAGKR